MSADKAEKKGGLFKRLFRRFRKGAEAEPEVPAEAPPAAAEPEAAEAAPELEAEAKPRKAEVKPPKAAARPAKKPAPAKKKAKPKPAPARRKAAAKPKREPARKRPEPAPAARPAPVPEPAPPAPAVEPPPAAPPPQAPAAPVEAAAEVEAETPRRGWFRRLRDGLSKSSRALSSGLADILTRRKLDDDTLQELEDVLVQADLGVDAAVRITEAVAKGRYQKEVSPEEVKQVLAEEIVKVLEPVEVPFEFDESQKPFVILVVGVNGTGKTTTIGKLATIARREGFSVTLAACDTFRAAAIEQLKVWGERTGAPVIARQQGADASGLAYDALAEARANGSDILIIDTAGRLQNKAHLMAELEKIVRVLKKIDDSAPHAVLLILDATTGQNAVSQAEVFKEIAGVTGIIMTKLDGTARGGILVAIAEKFALPVHAIGVGETVDDLQPFDASEFARAIVGLEESDAA